MKKRIEFQNNRRLLLLRSTAWLVLLSFIVQLLFPCYSLALTSGPSQPEVQSFEPVNTSEMVDLFTGDFTYNIPLFELPGPNGGYPFNLFYNSGVSNDQEASWVGLGWNLNPGAITRQMRGLPDEFNGAMVKHKMNIKPNVTFGLGVGADFEALGADVKEGTGGANLSLSLSFYYNNYKGVGYNTGAGISGTIAKNQSSHLSAGLGINLSIDSQEGVGVSPSVSLSHHNKCDQYDNMSVSIGYNSRDGLKDLSLGFSKTNAHATNEKTGHTDLNSVGIASVGSTSSLSLFSSGATPSISMPMQSRNFSIQFKIGWATEGMYLNLLGNGFFTSQYLKDRNKEISVPAYGYLNMQNQPDDKVLLDFEREKDAPILKTSPNLAIPSTNPDVYSVTGQGVGGMYRVFRNDIGKLHDQRTHSGSFGGAGGLEVGLGIGPEFGVDISVNMSQSDSGPWMTHDEQCDGINLDFKKERINNLFEPAYFKGYGEHTSDPAGDLDYMGGDKAVKANLDDLGNKHFAASLPGISQPTEDREIRNTVLSYINNDPNQGMVTTSPDGSRYVYGLVAKNTLDEEYLYAVGPNHGNDCKTINVDLKDGEPKHDYANTDEFYRRTVIEEDYAYAYHIQYILGADYVDANANGQPDDNDFGYWVKFSYTDGTDYNWRAPYFGANINKGLLTTFEDEKGSFLYGTKKIYYLTSVETKSHIAVFSITDREDGIGAVSRYQNSGTAVASGARQKKLDKISLYAKSDLTTPLKNINFQYSYNLCKSVPNNSGVTTGLGSNVSSNAGGKLTLEKVWYTYENSSRGSLSPYVFSYDESSAAENPTYDTHNYDRWGFYYPNANCTDVDIPYVRQFQSGVTAQTFRNQMNTYAAVWNLKSITLPTGGVISVEYEADDYGYVQNKRAMQMFNVIINPALSTNSQDVNDGSRRIYFEFEEPIANNSDKQSKLDEYFEGVDKLYFKLFMNMRQQGSNNYKDYVSGYNDIDSYGFDASSLDGNQYYTRAYIDLKKATIGTRKGAYRELDYHPFSLAAWQYLRTDNPKLTYPGNFTVDPNSGRSAVVNQVKSLASVISEVSQIFQGFYKFCKSRGFGRTLDCDKSFIRLNSPDKMKIGGGVRVKKIVLNDKWSASSSTESDSYYGQVYDYTTTEGGRTISSGVATYEPAFGGDENALRKAKEFTEAIPLKTSNKLFFEYPVNESYYPSPAVGYRKVTVKSLATQYESVDDNAQQAGNQNAYNIPQGIRTTGATVHEFYTAREFPVLTDETEIKIEPRKKFIPIPLIGQIAETDLTASQGYSITLNDMHGKLRKISNYKQLPTGEFAWDNEESSVEYIYFSERAHANADESKDYYKVTNTMPVLLSDKNGVANISNNYTIGVDHEFFVDMREEITEAESGGLKLNTDVMVFGPVIFPAFVPWPSVSYTRNMVRSVVTNKIIHRAGILKATVASDGRSTVRTDNLVFDYLTGQAVLTTMTNDFNDPIYNYDYLAYFAYEGMGPAYATIGLKFNASLSLISGNLYSMNASSTELRVGDELLFSNNVKGKINKADANGYTVAANGNPSSGVATVIRPGRRNLLTAVASNVKTLGEKETASGNPLTGRK